MNLLVFWHQAIYISFNFKFILQISRSIGDIYLKKPEYNREPLYAKFRLREPFKRPILSSDPSITVQELEPHDQFLILASDGLWEHLSNQEAVDIVQNSPRSVRSLTTGYFSSFLFNLYFFCTYEVYHCKTTLVELYCWL